MRAKLNLEKHVNQFRNLSMVALLLTSGILASAAGAPENKQKTFRTPEDASHALYTAVKNNDEKALLEIFGPNGKQVVSSGDEAEDAENRARFVQAYEEMNRLVKEPDGTVTLYIGARNWPAPIPIVKKASVWFFDTDAGKQEILFRRIGRNEMSAIQICRQLTAAEKEFYARQNNEYAQKIFSDEGKHDGLYWKASENQPESPIGPLVAGAVAEQYASNRAGVAVPYRGYYFHILTGQGRNAPGGARGYISNGKMTGGFAFVAYPADYRSSGVKTFLVSVDGVVYEKDLGNKTEAVAKSMKQFNPDSTWHKTVEEQDQP